MAGGDKNGEFSPPQDSSTLPQEPESEFEKLLKDSEDLGLNLTPRQREIASLKYERKKNDEIAAILNISKSILNDELRSIRKELERVNALRKELNSDFSILNEDAPDINYSKDCLTVKEMQVLSHLSSGLSVRTVASKMQTSAKSVYGVLKRNGLRAKDFKHGKRKSGSQTRAFTRNNYVPPDPNLVSLLRSYYARELKGTEKLEAEVALRAAGLIRYCPTVMQANADTLNTLAVSKRKKVFKITQRDEAALRHSRNSDGRPFDLLRHCGAALLTTDPYAKEEGGYNHVYAVSPRFWPAIVAIVTKTSSSNESNIKFVKDPVKGVASHGKTVTIRDLRSGETIIVKLVESGSAQSDDNGYVCVSMTAPLARALVGKTKGDLAEVEAVKGIKWCYEVLDVS